MPRLQQQGIALPPREWASLEADSTAPPRERERIWLQQREMAATCRAPREPGSKPSGHRVQVS